MTTRLRCVLLVDDDPAANFLHRLAIQSTDRVDHIIDVTSATEALDYLRECGTREASTVPDLLLLDINMPGMSGWELLDACLKEGIHLPALVSMLTTSENPDDRLRAEAHPAVADFLTKFMDAQDFVGLLDRHNAPVR